MSTPMDSKGITQKHYLSQPAAIALVFATLVSISTVVERHFSLTEARKDHVAMASKLDLMKVAVEENDRFWKDYGFSKNDVLYFNGSKECNRAFTACTAANRRRCDGEVSNVKEMEKKSATLIAEALCSKKLEELSENLNKGLVKNLKDGLTGIKDNLQVNGSVDFQKALVACQTAGERICDLEVAKGRDEARALATKAADGRCWRKLNALSGDLDKDVDKKLVEKLTDELSKLQKAFDKQVEENLKLAKLMVTKPSTGLNERVLTQKAVEAAKLAISKCGDFHKQVTTQGGHLKGYGPICRATDEDIAIYLNYTTRKDCPDDWYFVQDLLFVKNCFCLPKRTCFARSPPKFKAPLALPKSLWDTNALMDLSVRWELHHYKSFDAINTRTSGDCKNCFNLTLEETRWVKERHGTVALERVVIMKKGTLRIGLDVGGGTGSFAAKMAAYNCTILTTAMNTETLWDSNGGLPYMETIAARGLVPLHLPHKSRLPFFDNTLDIIHAVNSIKYFEIPEFEELMFEWDRVLRPGGLIWFELFYTPVTEMPLYVEILNLFNYQRLYWNMSPKTDAAEREGEHVYLNCILEKRRREN